MVSELIVSNPLEDEEELEAPSLGGVSGKQESPSSERVYCSLQTHLPSTLIFMVAGSEQGCEMTIPSSFPDPHAENAMAWAKSKNPDAAERAIQEDMTVINNFCRYR